MLLGSFVPRPVVAAELSYSTFAHVPVLHEGRVKPLDTFARVYLQQLYGEDLLPEQSAIAWLAGALFAPEKAVEQKIFRIESPQARKVLELEEREQPLYSYAEVAPSLDAKRKILDVLATKDANRYTAGEKALSQIYHNATDFAQIHRALSPLLPLNVALSENLTEQLELEGQRELTYLDLASKSREVMQKLKAIVKRKGEDPAKYTPQEQEVALLSLAMTTLELTGNTNALLRVIPVAHGDNNEWVTPWQVIRGGQGSPHTAAAMQQWKALASAYQAGDTEKWQQMTTDMAASQPLLTSVEVIYNRIALIPKLVWLYAAIFLLALWGWFQQTRFDWLRGAFAAVLVLHSVVIVTRIALLGRPPVSTLYESILFVALIAAGYGLWLAYRKSQQQDGLLIGSLLGGGLLAVSSTYAGQGDSMSMPIAVLNTNFWLATHVVCITIGYGCALIAGTLAHLELAGRPMKRLLPFAAVFALLFTAIGTILGGIWADQSWGRFWGWDPKENGALLIVLWLVWLLHGRIAGSLQERSFTALLAFTNVIVALSWFGVNLLNTGLHSYGFTDAAAYGLAVFCIAETTIIIALYGLSRKLKAQ